MTITRTGDEYFAAGKANAEGEAVFQIAVPVLETASNTRLLTVTQGQYSFKDYNFTTKLLSAATSVNTVCQLLNFPVGALPGKFSVADSKQVYFSQGNLWADATDPENPVFKFENNQYDFWRTWSASHVSHFFWSTFAKEAIKEESDFDGSVDDILFTNLTAESANPDFTVDGQTGKYRTLSENEWNYLLNRRNVNGGSGKDKSYSLNITYNGSKGHVLYPDDFNGPILSADTQYTGENFPINCVFLPAAGFRICTNFNSFGEIGGYYSSSFAGDGYSISTVFTSKEVAIDGIPYLYNISIRLVTDCE